MAEVLGEAVLILRTDDTALNGGVAKAKGDAEGLAATFDKGTASSARFGSGIATTGTAAEGAAAKFRQSAAGVTAATTSQSAGLAELARKVGDVSTGFGGAVNPAAAFEGQLGAAKIAAAAVETGAGALAGALTGPLGIAFALILQALTPFIAEMFAAKAAEEQLKVANDSLATSQEILGKIFDLNTGKIRANTAELRLNALTKANNQLIDAKSKDQSSFSTLLQAGDPSVGDRLTGSGLAILGAAGGGVPFIDAGRGRLKGNEDVRKLAEQARQSANIVIDDDRANAVARIKAFARLTDFSGSGVSQKDFIDALTDREDARFTKRNAQAAIESIETGKLNPRFLAPRTPRAPRSGGGSSRKAGGASESLAPDPTADDIAKLNREEIRARLDLTTNVIDRAALQRELLGIERDERIRAIEADKRLDADQKAARIAYIKRLYGDPSQSKGPDGEVIVRPDTSLYGQRITRDREDASARLRNDELGRQADVLSAQASIADTLGQRAKLEARALELQQQIARNLLEQDIANGRIADADKARALLAERQAVDRQRQGRSNEGPLARYARRLDENSKDINTQVEGYVVDELESVRQSLHRGISKVIGIDDPLINGLIDILIEQLVLKPLADALNQAGSGGEGGIFGAIIGAIGSIFGGGRAGGGTVSAGKIYAVNERSTTPGFFMPIGAGMIQPADTPTPGGGAGGGGGAPYFDLRGAVVTEDLLKQMNAISQANVRAGLASYDRGVGASVANYKDRFE